MYTDCERRRVHPCHGTAAGDSGCGRGVLRLVGRPGTGEEPRGVRVIKEGTGEAGLHAAETKRGGNGPADAGLPVPDGHRYLAAERPRHRADGETFYRQGREREILRHVLGVRTGTGGTSAHRG